MDAQAGGLVGELLWDDVRRLGFGWLLGLRRLSLRGVYGARAVVIRLK